MTNKIKIAYIYLLLIIGPSVANAGLLTEQLIFPQTGITLNNFVPKDWFIENQINNDLDDDALLDTILVLKERSRKQQNFSGTLGARVLVILFRNKDNSFRLGGVGKNLLWCEQCYGTLSESNGGTPEIKVKNKIISIYQAGGSREAIDIALKFRYENASSRFRLVGEDLVVRDRLSMEINRESRNYLNGVRITENVIFDENGENEKSTKRIEKISPAKLRLFIDTYNINTR
ncbi:MAG TPA: hypothetical protein VK949_08305 [Methylotenera sp.]|nr:hypothetical protein [Methylotenera sp.]